MGEGDGEEDKHTGEERRKYDRHPRTVFYYTLQATLAKLLTGSLNIEEATNALERKSRAESRQDAVTKVLPREVFMDELEEEIRKSEKNPQRNLGVVFVDVDDFRQFNENFGHDGGDAVLASIGKALQGSGGKVGRLGGDEFAVIFSEVDRERMQEMTKETGKRVQEGHLGATVSMGLAYYKQGDTLPELLTHADRNLYEAKRHGRNGMWAEGYEGIVKYH